jgi:hypothetical protein
MSKLFGVSIAVALALTVGLSSTPGSARVGQRCRGIYPQSCGANEFCQLPPGSCNPRAWGRCVAVPAFCYLLYKPVCGCNNNTYSNDCFRQQGRTSLRHNGPC